MRRDQRHEATSILRPLVAKRTQIVQQMTRVKDRIHSLLHANLIRLFPGKAAIQR